MGVILKTKELQRHKNNIMEIGKAESSAVTKCFLAFDAPNLTKRQWPGIHL